MFVTIVSQVLELWGMSEAAGADALVRCAVDAAALTIEGIPWSVFALCRRYAELFGGTATAVHLSMERALLDSGVKYTPRQAICKLVGYALRDRLGAEWRNPVEN